LNNAVHKYQKRITNVLSIDQVKTTKDISMEKAVEKFIKEMRTENLAVRTIAFHQENLVAFQKTLAKQNVTVRPLELTIELIKNNFILYMVERGYKPNTINGRIKSLRKFSNFLYEEGYLKINPAPQLKKVKGKTTIIQSFSPDQVRRLLAAPNQTTFTGYRDYTIFVLMLDTGIRLAELCKLKLSDINLADGTLWASSKNTDGEVPVTAKYCKVLKKYLFYRAQREPDNEHVFITVDGAPLKRRTVQDQFKKYGKAACLENVRVSPHTMRHTFAKHYILAGGDAFSLQKVLRHKSMDTVRIYVNLWGGEVKKQHDKFSPLVNF